MYTLQFQKQDTLQSSITSGATSATLTSGNFGSPTGTQFYVIDYDNANAEVVSATVSGTAMTSVARGLDGTSAVAHSAGAKVLCAFVPSHYAALLSGTAGFTFDKVRVTKSSAQTCGNGASVAITWDGEDFDTNGLHSTFANTTRLTAATAGYYLIQGILNWEYNSTGVRQATIVLNGATTIGVTVAQHGGTTDLAVGCSCIYYLSAGQYVELYGQQNSGGALNVRSSGSHFSMTMLP